LWGFRDTKFTKQKAEKQPTNKQKARQNRAFSWLNGFLLNILRG
jgi:hypothetical protein